ncbi:hypothetical protein PanWU01x14_105290 [Parasponia andersonii]|uniref:Uncharacterized protein n=1 Tax=Parasponia andersonii TaxID=3476 RepID=A0A2P5D1F6_PARAD|nr:hypothetical protein PanWU01x14_105290 [Parasponia andersonii]
MLFWYIVTVYSVKVFSDFVRKAELSDMVCLAIVEPLALHINTLCGIERCILWRSKNDRLQ